MTLLSCVHYDVDYNNAFWDSKCMNYGDGDKRLFMPLVGAVDVTGHEIGHGLIQNTANLVYFGQSGAANESFADIFGITLKQYLRGEGDPLKANWLVGSEIVGPEFPGKGIRSFKDEKAFDGDDQPKHMKDFVRTFDDNGGVHTNSGILNFFFYLMCTYMNQPSYGKPIQIMYNTLLVINKFANFKTIVKNAIKVSDKLYGKHSPESEAIFKAAKEVGIL